MLPPDVAMVEGQRFARRSGRISETGFAPNCWSTFTYRMPAHRSMSSTISAKYPDKIAEAHDLLISSSSPNP